MLIQTSYGLLTSKELGCETETRMCQRITMASGNVIIVNTNQKFRTVVNNTYEFKNSLELNRGDKLVVALGDHTTCIPDKLSAKQAYFIGWFLRRSNLYSLDDVITGNEMYRQAYGIETLNVFELKPFTDIPLDIRTGSLSIIESFLSGLTGYIRGTDVIRIEDCEYPFYSDVLALARSIGVECMHSLNDVKYWNGFILDEIITIEDVMGESFKLKLEPFYKLNGVITK